MRLPRRRAAGPALVIISPETVLATSTAEGVLLCGRVVSVTQNAVDKRHGAFRLYCVPEAKDSSDGKAER